MTVWPVASLAHGQTEMKVKFEEMFPWEFAEALAKAPIGYLPLGVLEWHGEHNAVGLDALKAHAVCVRAARQSGGVVVPLVYWATDEREEIPDGSYITGGVEHGERYHVPGSMFWIRPETFRALLLDIFEAMRRRGFQAIIALAGHWPEEPTMTLLRATARNFQAEHPDIRLIAITEQELAVDLDYRHEHAAEGETSLLLAIRADLVDLSKTLETDGSLRPFYSGQPQHLQRRRVTPNKYIGVLTAAADGSHDPELATPERGQQLLEAISQRLAARALALLVELDGSKPHTTQNPCAKEVQK
jgi:creatinine amidohydrolase